MKIVRILGVVKTALPGVLNRGETTVPCASVRPRVCVCARTSFTYNVHRCSLIGILLLSLLLLLLLLFAFPRAGQWTMGARRRKKPVVRGPDVAQPFVPPLDRRPGGVRLPSETGCVAAAAAAAGRQRDEHVRALRGVRYGVDFSTTTYCPVTGRG